MKKTIVPDGNGDFYVAVEARDWPAAMAQQSEQTRARHERLAEWEKAHGLCDRTSASYWDAYRAEKYRIPVQWALPAGHVVFSR